MRQALARLLDWPHAVAAACGITLALGYTFIFVWAPHPWSWQGIDAYHELARSLARGEPFQTTDVPWGYAYYAAFFYRTFGERIWIPLVFQATLNASVPLLIYRLIQPLAGRRSATLAALVTGVFSFSTVYASTQSSDTICTFLFMLALVAFSSGLRHGGWGAIVFSGALMGLVPQFRPNMVLFPALMALAGVVIRPRTARRWAQMAAFLLLVAAAQAPWVVRNYQLTGMLLPTSTHGGVQLWYGTLQVGPYLESRAHNPRYNFESPALPYTSLTTTPLEISGEHALCVDRPGEVTSLIYWTDRDATRRTLTQSLGSAPRFSFRVPTPPIPTTLYYYFETAWPAAAQQPALRFVMPFEGAANPYVAFVSNDHLGDLDAHDDFLDIFDIARLMQHLAWGGSLRAAEQLDFDRNGTVTADDLAAAVHTLLGDARDARSAVRFEHTDLAATVHLPDGSWLRVPRAFGGKQTDLELEGPLAGVIVSRSRTFTSITHPPRRAAQGECLFTENVALDTVFFRREPHMMQRYMALAFDNIARDPGGFAVASLYRAVRLFVIRGTSDLNTAQQFRWSELAYGAGTLLSLAYLGVFLAGAVIAIKRRSALVLLLVPIVYVPVTICFVLTNMRYTLTVQPLMFAFMAVAVVAALGLEADEERALPTAAAP